ncbi:MAG: TetR/AcrR family transcriptional regulator [Lachnospiraceae bacterium]|nr:TetR/AcrR family transcriptional regulator [Lachnospiraceae bacterium]
MINVEDERYHVADVAIQDAFVLVMEEKEIEKISVADVIKKAGIVRSTFYNHYENMDYLIAAMEDKTVNDIFSIMTKFNLDNDRDICKSYFLTICNYTKDNSFLRKCLRSSRGNEILRKSTVMFHNYVKQLTRKKYSVNGGAQSADTLAGENEFSYMVASVIGCTLGVLHKWTEDGFNVPAEEIAEILTLSYLNGSIRISE